jgi:glutamate N-acetyltransferase / amino-acid N-acetyltransferase
MKLAVGDAELHLPLGFSFSSVSAGIKVSGRPDLALIECSPGSSAAAVFTKNRVVAAPVVIDHEALRRGRGKIRAVIVNSGNANCATGSHGLRACREVCTAVARTLNVKPQQIFPSSTGIIGVRLPAEKILAQLPELISTREATPEAAKKFARTIMTTDTRPKLASQCVTARGANFRILGVAKGAGMIHPNLATMLVYLMTDVRASAAQLRQALAQAVDESFNCISIDGDTSTNDTVLLIASQQSPADLSSSRIKKLFAAVLSEICKSLAEQIVSDGEGVHHVIHLSIEGARNRAEAMRVAQAVAYSPLCKTAWAGADPNWGRILAAIGRSGVDVNPEKISVFIGEQKVCQRGQYFPFDETDAHQHLSQPDCYIRVRLGRGRAGLRFLTTDLTSEYVHINADYST